MKETLVRMYDVFKKKKTEFVTWMDEWMNPETDDL